MGVVKNLAVAQLALEVRHDALAQCGHPAQVVGVYLVHDAKDALPVCARHGRLFPSPCQPLTRLILVVPPKLLAEVRSVTVTNSTTSAASQSVEGKSHRPMRREPRSPASRPRP